MNRCCKDARVWIPVAIAAICFSLRLRPLPATSVAAAPRAVALPTLHGAPLQKTDIEYMLDAERSTVRFLVAGADGELLVACPTIRGRLLLRTLAETSELEIEMDLGSLLPLGPTPSPIDLHRLLGVHRGSEIVYRATLLRSSTSSLPGVTERLWLGTLRLGNRIIRQPMQLWQSSLVGQPLRLQGHGPVDTADYGLPRRSWLGLVQETHVVTLGLDLVWRRTPSR